MSERDSENFEIDEEFVAEAEDSTDYDGLLARVDKRVRSQGKKGKAAWSKLEEVLAIASSKKTCANSSTTNSFRQRRRSQPTLSAGFPFSKAADTR